MKGKIAAAIISVIALVAAIIAAVFVNYYTNSDKVISFDAESDGETLAFTCENMYPGQVQASEFRLESVFDGEIIFTFVKGDVTALLPYLNAEVIPHGTVVRQNFETIYKNKRKNTSAENVMLQVGNGVIAYIQHYDNNMKKGYGFSLDKFENKKLVSHMTAMEVQYDTISDSKYHWTATNWKIRELRGLREHITQGAKKDTLIQMEPTDLVYSKGQQETFTSSELKDYISKQIDRGSGNVVQYQVEYHKRIASSFASFILTTIGVSLSSRKRKGGMGLYLGFGLALSFTYIMLQTVSSTFAINANTPPILAAWIPNIIFAVVAYFCYRKAPN